MHPRAARRVFSNSLILLFLAVGCVKQTPTEGFPPEYTSISVHTTAVPSGWYSVYFTDPSGPAAEYYSGGPDEALAAAIDRLKPAASHAILNGSGQGGFLERLQPGRLHLMHQPRP